MVSRLYLDNKPKASLPVKRVLDQDVIPALIDKAAAVESLIAHAGAIVARRPAMSLAALIVGGAILVAATRPGPRRPRLFLG